MMKFGSFGFYFFVVVLLLSFVSVCIFVMNFGLDFNLILEIIFVVEWFEED